MKNKTAISVEVDFSSRDQREAFKEIETTRVIARTVWGIAVLLLVGFVMCIVGGIAMQGYWDREQLKLEYGHRQPTYRLAEQPNE